MKKDIRILPTRTIFILSLFVLVFSCSKDHTDQKTYTYTIYSPVYKPKAEVLSSINGLPTTAIEHAGKLYIKDNFIYLNEVNKGIHIIDNSNPSHPVQTAFLAIPGNLDIAIKDNILYADMYNDLLAIDITDQHHVKVSNTLGNFFTGRYSVNGYDANSDAGVVVDWNEKDTTVAAVNYPYYECLACMFEANGGPLMVGTKSSGTAGSMAGMVIMNSYLYAISEMHSLGIVDITNAAAPKLDSSFFAGFDLQTIYPFEDKLFLGSAIGMFMYDVSDPQHPVSAGQFEHGRACDPVISDGSYAYVTLHSGTDCGGDENELDIINIQDLTNSELAKTYALTKPTGLCKDGNLLFVCDGNAVKIYNAINPLNLILLHLIASNEPYDVIAANGKAMVVAADGLYQYDYKNINNIRLMSFLPAKR